ncbi:DUF4148 domain-containing protein [Caballeronia sp. KNU42]
MNFRQLTLVVAAALAFPIASHAQETTSTLTRAQVRAELVQVEKAGYRPGNNDPHYPDDIQAAEAKVAAADGSPVNIGSGFGGVTSGTFASGMRSAYIGSSGALYARH